MTVGRIVATVNIQNGVDTSKAIQCEALVDTGASLMVLPRAWRNELGDFESSTEISVETATQDTVIAEVCGPVRIQIEGFRSIFNEVAFIDMNPADGQYEPLIGYIVLEQSQASVDMLGHRLVPIKHMDLKCAVVTGWAALQTTSSLAEAASPVPSTQNHSLELLQP